MHNIKYFGFIETQVPEHRTMVLEYLNRKDSYSVGKYDIESDIVEEIVRRGGKFYNAVEARPIAPFEIESDKMFCANFPYRDNEPRPINPAYADSDWAAISFVQYCYGKYLTNMIVQGMLSVKDLTPVVVVCV